MQQCNRIGSSDGGVTECLWLAEGISRVLLRSRCVACRPAGNWVSLCVLSSSLGSAAAERSTARSEQTTEGGYCLPTGARLQPSRTRPRSRML